MHGRRRRQKKKKMRRRRRDEQPCDDAVWKAESGSRRIDGRLSPPRRTSYADPPRRSPFLVRWAPLLKIADDHKTTTTQTDTYVSLLVWGDTHFWLATCSIETGEARATTTYEGEADSAPHTRTPNTNKVSGRRLRRRCSWSRRKPNCQKQHLVGSSSIMAAPSR